MAMKRRKAKTVRLKVSSAAKLLRMSMYEVQQNARHFGITPAQVVVKVMKDRGIIR